MSITREQVADLREGDVVELRDSAFPDVVTRGPVRRQGSVHLGSQMLAWSDGRPATWTGACTLTVVSRAPRPLYVNHPRTEPVPGDVANPGDGTSSVAFRTIRNWIWPNGTSARLGTDNLRLLIDGETGQVVP